MYKQELREAISITSLMTSVCVALQDLYKQELQEAFGITFNSLFCLNNMPIKRYADYLIRKKELESYMQVAPPPPLSKNTSPVWTDIAPESTRLDEPPQIFVPCISQLAL